MWSPAKCLSTFKELIFWIPYPTNDLKKVSCLGFILFLLLLWCLLSLIYWRGQSKSLIVNEFPLSPEGVGDLYVGTEGLRDLSTLWGISRCPGGCLSRVIQMFLLSKLTRSSCSWTSGRVSRVGLSSLRLGELGLARLNPRSSSLIFRRWKRRGQSRSPVAEWLS